MVQSENLVMPCSPSSFPLRSLARSKLDLKQEPVVFDGVLIGRSFVYGLSVDGKNGVKKSLEILNKELDMTMALCGKRDINMVGRDIIKDCPFFEKN